MSATAVISVGTLTTLYAAIVKLRNAIQTWNARARQVQQTRLQCSLDRFQRVCDEEDTCRADKALQKTVTESGFRLLQSRQTPPS